MLRHRPMSSSFSLSKYPYASTGPHIKFSFFFGTSRSLMEFNASFQNPFSSRLLQFLLYDYLHPFELNFGNLVLTLKSSYPPGQPNVNTTGFLFPQILILNIVELSYRDKAMQIVSTTTHRLQHPWLVPHCISHGILTTGQKSMCMTPKVHRALESTVSVHTR